MSWRDDVVKELLAWERTPYHSEAKIKGVGVDCGQLLIGVFEGAGVIPRGECNPDHYAQDWHLHRSEEKYLSWVKKYCKKTNGKPLPGILPFINLVGALATLESLLSGR